MIESCCRYGSANWWVAFESVSSIFIPEVERAIWSCSTKSTMDWVKGDGIDAEDLDFVVFLNTMESVSMRKMINIKDVPVITHWFASVAPEGKLVASKY